MNEHPTDPALRALPSPPLPPDVEARAHRLARLAWANDQAIETSGGFYGRVSFVAVPALLVSAGLVHTVLAVFAMVRIWG